MLPFKTNHHRPLTNPSLFHIIPLKPTHHHYSTIHCHDQPPSSTNSSPFYPVMAYSSPQRTHLPSTQSWPTHHLNELIFLTPSTQSWPAALLNELISLLPTTNFSQKQIPKLKNNIPINLKQNHQYHFENK